MKIKAHARIRITKVLAPDELGDEIEEPMRNLGNALGRRMQRLAPKATWRLHDSIQKPETEVRGAKVTTSIAFGGRMVSGKMVDYHLLVEDGTSKMAAQPYAKPALYQTRSADLRSEVVMADKHGTPAERRLIRNEQRRIRRMEHEAES